MTDQIATQIRVPASFTRDGQPSLWERGGAVGKSGHSIIIANVDGLPKVAEYLPGLVCRHNGHHALFPIQVGDLVVSARMQHQSGLPTLWVVKVYRVASITPSDSPIATWRTTIDLELLAEHRTHRITGQWDTPAADTTWQYAAAAAMQKAACYHCQATHFADGGVTLPSLGLVGTLGGHYVSPGT